MSIRQYYYKVAGCRAISPESLDCICWHDEGTGPLADGNPEPEHWRDKPGPCCPDWEPQLAKINAVIGLKSARSGFTWQYDGIPFRFCPWCGAAVKPSQEVAP